MGYRCWHEYNCNNPEVMSWCACLCTWRVRCHCTADHRLRCRMRSYEICSLLQQWLRQPACRSDSLQSEHETAEVGRTTSGLAMHECKHLLLKQAPKLILPISGVGATVAQLALCNDQRS